MGATNTEHFTVMQNNLASLAKALGHPARVAILEYLIKVKSAIAGDIVKEMPLAQPTISQHLKELKSSGLIKGINNGNTIIYAVEESALEKLQLYFTNSYTKLRTGK